jgi:hypothetical protein
MPPSVRRLLAAFAGVLVAISVVVLADALVARAFPLPADLDTRDAARAKAALAAVPARALALLVAGWAIAAGAGAFVAVRLTPGRRIGLGLVVAGFLLASTIANLVALPHPTWVWPVALLLIPAVGWLGARAGTDPPSGGRPGQAGA